MQNSELNQEQGLQATIQNEIKKYSLPDAAIAELKEKYSGITFTSLEDKQNVKLIERAYQEVKKYRTGIENKRKELKKEYLETGRAIDGEAKRLTELLLEIEDPLAEQYALIKEAKEAEKIRKEQEKKAVLLKRVETLEEAGLEFDGNFYSLGNISLDITTIEQLPQEAYENLLTRVGEEKTRLEKEEQERIRAEQEKAEQERLEAERKEKERQQLEAEKQEMIKMRIESRSEYLTNIGFVKHTNELNNNSQFFFLQIGNKNLTFQVQDIGEMDLPTWNDFKDGLDETISEAKQALQAEQEAERKRQQKAKEEAEKAEAERIAFEEAEKIANEVLKTRSKTLEENGFAFSHSLNSFLFTNEIGSVEISLDNVKYTDDETYNDILQKTIAKINDLKQQQLQAEQEQRRVAEERKQQEEIARLAKLGDKEKVNEYFNKLRSVIQTAPDLQLQQIDQSFKQLNAFVLDQLAKFENRFNN